MESSVDWRKLNKIALAACTLHQCVHAVFCCSLELVVYDLCKFRYRFYEDASK